MIIAPRGLVVCVNYDDLLAITLVRNMRFMAECIVVTAPEDERTKAVACSVPWVQVFETDAFTRYGARFNKGLAIEEALDAYGRAGWMLIWDADTLFPETTDLSTASPDHLNGSRRVILEDASAWNPDFDWRQAGELSNDHLGIGFFQLFHADADPLRGTRPWYDPTFAHAGGCDAYFLDLWPRDRVSCMPFPCLHLGPVATNWYQRSSPRLDRLPVESAAENLALMNSFIKRANWSWARPGLKFEEMREVPETPYRVDVPGYSRDYEVPVMRQLTKQV